MPEKAETVVVGAGVVGLFTAFYASEQGSQVLVLERDRPGAGASTGNAGVLHLIQPPPGKLRRRLALLGAREYRTLAETIGIEIMETSLLIVAENRWQSIMLHATKRVIPRIAGGVRPRLVRDPMLHEIEPALADHITMALLVPGYGVVHPPTLIEKLVKAATQTGATIKRSTVERIRCNDKIIVETSNGETIIAQKLVNASGESSHILAGQLGIRIKVRLHPGTMELSAKPKPRNIIARIPTTSKTKGGAIIPWPNNQTLYGPTFDQEQATPGEVIAKYSSLLNEPPSPPQARITGKRTVAKPRDFHIIQPQRCPKTVHLIGIESPGLTAAPILARKALNLLHRHAT